MSTVSIPKGAHRRSRFVLLCTIVAAIGCVFVIAATTPTTIVAQDEATDTTYVVQPGDSLSVIAKRFGVRMADLMARNELSDADFIYVGQQLFITDAITATAIVAEAINATATVAEAITATAVVADEIAVPVTITATAIVTGTTGVTVTVVATDALLATVEPVTTSPLHPTVEPTPTVAEIATTIYTVQVGDTLSAIARRFQTTTADLMARNGLRNANFVYVGQELEVLVIAEPSTDTASASRSTDEELAPTRVTFATDATSATVEGTITFPARSCYVVEASAGQEMQISITSGGALANFLVRAADRSINGGVPLKRLENEDRAWQYTLPASGDYLICVATAEGAVAYTLTITIPVACTSVTQEIEVIDWATIVQNDSALSQEEIGGEKYVTVIASPTNTTGVPQLEEIVYGDFDGDCTEEAGIPLFSGGTAGNVGFLVYDLPDESALPTLTAWGEGYKLLLAADSGLLIVSNALYNGWEPNCCPSGISYEGYRLRDGDLILVSVASEGVSEMRSETVSHFYTLLQERNFVDAYTLLSPTFQAANPFATWEAGYANTESIGATVTPDPSVANRMAVTLEVNERLSSGVTRIRHYSGYWDLSWDSEALGWILQNGSFVVVP